MTKRVETVADDTLGALRAALERAGNGLPDTATVRVQTRLKFGADGQPVKQVTVITD